MLWRRKWQPTPVFLPGVSHGQRSLAGYSSCSHKESDMAEWLTHTNRNTKHTTNGAELPPRAHCHKHHRHLHLLVATMTKYPRLETVEMHELLVLEPRGLQSRCGQGRLPRSCRWLSSSASATSGGCWQCLVITDLLQQKPSLCFCCHWTRATPIQCEKWKH